MLNGQPVTVIHADLTAVCSAGSLMTDPSSYPTDKCRCLLHGPSQDLADHSRYTRRTGLSLAESYRNPTANPIADVVRPI
jgi:hypothetical protein